MEVFEKVNLLIKERGLNKKEFSLRVIALEPKLKSTGEIPTLKTMYTYLSGHIGLKIELVPYIAEVLDIPEQILFDDSSRVRMKYIRHILSTMNPDEKHQIKQLFCKDNEDAVEYNREQEYPEIIELLDYASPAHLKKIKLSLQDFKSITDKFN